MLQLKRNNKKIKKKKDYKKRLLDKKIGAVVIRYCL